LEVARSQERDPYYTHGKLERLNLRIRQSLDIRPENKQLFLAFVKWLTSDATGVKSESRVLKYHLHFWLILFRRSNRNQPNPSLEEERKRRYLHTTPETIRVILSESLAQSTKEA
jgi:hypothetical protein